MYGIASFNEGEPSTAPSLTLTGRKKEPDQLQTADGWAKFTGGFFFGGISGVTWAYFLLYVLNLPYYFKWFFVNLCFLLMYGSYWEANVELYIGWSTFVTFVVFKIWTS